MRRLFTHTVVLALTALLFAAGCSIPTESSAQVIDQEKLPEALRNTSTTTTSTPTGSTEPFVYFLLQQRADQASPFVVSVTRLVERGLTTTEKLRPLFGDDFITAEEEEGNLFSRMGAFDLVAVDANESGIATVRLVVDDETDLDAGLLADIAAQLVWTLTELPQIDAILIEVNGELTALRTEEGDVSESVDTADFPRYDREFEFPEAPEETTTTTTSTTLPTTTTVPGDG